MPISPDDYMDRPIESLVWGCYRMTERSLTWIRLLIDNPKMGDDPSVKPIIDKDDQMQQAYIVSMRLRCAEVASYIHRCGLECYPYEVEDNPMQVSLAWGRWMCKQEDEADDATE